VWDRGLSLGVGREECREAKTSTLCEMGAPDGVGFWRHVHHPTQTTISPKGDGSLIGKITIWGNHGTKAKPAAGGFGDLTQTMV
jgi:hypothetical protein